MNGFQEAFVKAQNIREEDFRGKVIPETVKQDLLTGEACKMLACQIMVETFTSELSKIFQERLANGLLFVIVMPQETFKLLHGEDVDTYEKKIDTVPPEFIKHVLVQNPNPEKEVEIKIDKRTPLTFTKTIPFPVDLSISNGFLKGTKILCADFETILKNILPETLKQGGICLLHAMRIDF